MRIILKKGWLGHKSGSEVTVNDQTGLRLVESKMAKVVVETPPPDCVTCTRCGAFIKLDKTLKAKVGDLLGGMISDGTEKSESKAA